MAEKNYQWTAALTVQSGGYSIASGGQSNELISIEKDGVELFSGSVTNPPQTFNIPWTTTSDLTGSATYTYTYRDSDTTQNSNSTKVAVTVKDDWTVDIDNRNYMTVTVHTTMVSAVRTKIGSPSNVNRHLWLRRTQNGQDYNPFPKIDNGNTAHTIASNVDMGSYTFALAPGENAQRSTVWWRNTSVGHESDRIPNKYTDILGIGVHFKNILPKDYRPGKIWNGSAWMSHNRSTGWAGVWNGTTFKEMRTENGAVGTDNPPYIRNVSQQVNQRQIGTE